MLVSANDFSDSCGVERILLLRSCVSEKGSRWFEILDLLFDTVYFKCTTGDYNIADNQLGRQSEACGGCSERSVANRPACVA